MTEPTRSAAPRISGRHLSGRRPPRFPPPEFPPRRRPAFARMPPAVFPAVLGLLGLGLALRRAGLGALAELELGLVLGLWLFALVGLKVKLWRRPAVLGEDLRVLPGRAGLAAATMGGMAAGTVLVPYAPGLALWVTLVALLAHLALAGVQVAVLAGMPPEARQVNPVWHLALVGMIVGAVPLAQLGWTGLATGILLYALTMAAVIWGLSLWQFLQRVPPAPLRPLLAIHLAPAALCATVADGVGMPGLAQIMAGVAVVILVVLLGCARWLLAAGVTPMWGALTFPLAACATALLAVDGVFRLPGLAVLLLAGVAVPLIAWRVLSLWPGGRLAAMTNAAEA